MAFKTFRPKREAVTLAALAQRLSGRTAVVGAVKVPRNSGENRTPSKRALLKAIKDQGGEW